jgi:hypothetical protein
VDLFRKVSRVKAFKPLGIVDADRLGREETAWRSYSILTEH